MQEPDAVKHGSDPARKSERWCRLITEIAPLRRTTPTRFILLVRRYELIALFLFGALAVYCFMHGPSSAIQVLFGVLCLAGLGLLCRRDSVGLFGRVFLYDLFRTTRRSRCIFHRTLYATALLVILFLAYASLFPGRALELLFRPVPLQARDLSRCAESFFTAFVYLQSLVVTFVTPVYVAGAIAEEKERRTLEYLLTSDLSDREIVLGKLAARVTNLFLLVLTGLPVLALLQVIGGVDPHLLLAVFAGTIVTIISLASLSLLASVLRRTALEAMLTANAWMLIAFMVTLCGAFVPKCNFGNPLAAFYKLKLSLGDGTKLSEALTAELVSYVLCHGALATTCCTIALRRFRTTALGKDLPATRTEERVLPLTIQRSASASCPNAFLLDERPVLWKEISQSHHVTWYKPAGFTGSVLSMYLVLFVTALVFYYSFLFGFLLGETFRVVEPNTHVRLLGTSFACALLFVISLSAAARVSREREQHTLENLLTTDLSRREILYDKVVASIWCLRPIWWVLAPIWAFEMLGGGLHALAAALLAITWGVYATFAACLGLWFSSVSRNSVRAALGTILALSAVTVAPCLLTPLFGGLSRLLPYPEAVSPLNSWPSVALSPPAAIWAVMPDPNEFDWWAPSSGEKNFLGTLTGLPAYALAAYLLWRASCTSLSGQKSARQDGKESRAVSHYHGEK